MSSFVGAVGLGFVPLSDHTFVFNQNDSLAGTYKLLPALDLRLGWNSSTVYYTPIDTSTHGWEDRIVGDAISRLRSEVEPDFDPKKGADEKRYYDRTYDTWGVQLTGRVAYRNFTSLEKRTEAADVAPYAVDLGAELMASLNINEELRLLGGVGGGMTLLGGQAIVGGPAPLEFEFGEDQLFYLRPALEVGWKNFFASAGYEFFFGNLSVTDPSGKTPPQPLAWTLGGVSIAAGARFSL